MSAKKNYDSFKMKEVFKKVSVGLYRDAAIHLKNRYLYVCMRVRPCIGELLNVSEGIKRNRFGKKRCA